MIKICSFHISYTDTEKNTQNEFKPLITSRVKLYRTGEENIRFVIILRRTILIL